MYGQGNFVPPTTQGPYTSTSMFHQHPPAPSLPPFSQGSQPPRSTLVQHGPLPVPSQVGQLGHPSYEHTPSGPHLLGPPLPVPSSGVNSRPYLTPAPAPPPPPTQSPQMRANSQMPQNSQWVQNAHFVPSTVPPVAPRFLPPPPSQGQIQYGSQVQQPPPRGMQAHLQHHHPTSRFFTSPQVGAFGQPQHSNMLATGPPPPHPPPLPTLPPGAPPLPPSSPPPTSSFTFSNNHIPKRNATISGSAFHAQNGSEIDRSVGFVDEVSASYVVGDDACKRDGSGNSDRESASKMSSSCMKNLILDLPPPPPKPVDDRTVRSIEVLCQFIAKNGPEFEDMTRQKEFGNPQFKFLFGGEPGSEDAAAHEYFIWMKNKCQLAFKSAGQQQTNDSPVRTLGDYSSQPSITTNPGVPRSPSDSDMDMEDDITHPDEELQIYASSNPSHETVSVSDDLDMKDQMQLSHGREHGLGEDAVDGKSVHCESLALEEHRQGSRTSSDQNRSMIRNSAAKADGSVVDSSGNVESLLDVKEQYSFSPAKTDLVESSSEKHPDQLVKGASPFRLLQDYASEGSSDDEASVEDAVPSTVSPAIEVHSTSHDKNTEDKFGAVFSPKSLSLSNKECDPLYESCKSQDFPCRSQAVIMKADMTSAVGKSKFLHNIYNNQGLVKDVVSHEALHKEDASTDANVDTHVAKKDTMSMSTKLKVDKFGRLTKEAASDSDSDGSLRYTGWRGKRDRSRTRSRSPHDRRRRRRRRSPWGRKEMRGRSRSFSPKRRRSRSKSPPYRDDEYPGDKMRRGKGQFPECFDFRRGKCYRGASCRYLHHEDKNDRSRSDRSKQSLQDLARSSRRSDLNERNENAPQQKLCHQHDEGRFQGLKPCEHMSGIGEKKILSEPAAHPSDKGGHLEPGILENPVADPVKLHLNATHVIPTSVGKLEPEQFQGHYPDKVFQNLDQQHERMDEFSESSPNQTSVSVPSQIPGDKPQLEKDSIIDSHTILSNMNKPENIPFQSVAPHESILPATGSVFHLSPSSFPLPSQEMTASYAEQVPSASNSASVENYPAYQASISYPHSQFPVPPNPVWNSLPPPPALPHPSRPFPVNDMIGTSSTHGQYSDMPVHFQQNMVPSRNQFLPQTSTGPYITEFPTVSRVGQKQKYASMQEPDRPSHPLDDLQLRKFPTSQKIGKLHGGPGHSLQGLYPLNSYVAESVHLQTLPFSRESPSKSVPPADSVSSLPGDDGKVSSTVSRYTSDLLDRNEPIAEFGGSRISSHYNPYASTFEQPLSSKFSSNILIQEKDRPYGSHFGAAYSFRHVPGDGRAVSLGSNMISQQNTVRGAEGSLPRPTGDQYDPLYDSIEPSSNSVKKPGPNFEGTDESDIMIRRSGSNEPLDVEENKKQKGGGTIALTASVENEEYGETADAEVGAVEDGSPSNPNDAEDIAAGEVEIDQVRAPGKSKKNKDSRSMKLFKVALANFVKEVLKPSWRQGNMSKEAFKTIVKKTVDKVSGAMKGHQVPKSQTKINRYIDSSQRKLTKLVMGYVDKYVKV